MKEDKEQREIIDLRRGFILVTIFFIIVFIALLYTTFLSTKYKVMYETAFNEAVERTIFGGKMLTACSSLSNVTFEEIRDEFIRLEREEWLNEDLKEKGE